MAITSTDIEAVIATEDDFGHEMRVGRVLRGYLGSQTSQGGTYADPVSGKARQFDFRWRYQLGEFGLSLAIECKNPARVIRRITGNDSVYFPEAFVGKSLLQLKKKEGKYTRTRDVEIYEKWSQALASAVDLVHTAGRNATAATNQHVFTFVVPVVVLPDDSLWKIEYDVNGKIVGHPQPANEVDFFVAHEASPSIEPGDLRQPYVFSHLHFLTLTGFAALLLRITSDKEWLRSAFHEQVIAAAKAERVLATR